MSDGDASTVDGSLFEALAKALQPEGAFAEELRQAGFDVRAPKLRYPQGVLIDTLDITHRHVYPDLAREVAHRRIGQRMVSVFFETIFGRVVRTLLQVLGPERFLVRLPKIAPMGTTGLEIQVERPAPGEIRLTFKGRRLSPWFIAGAVDTIAEGISVDLVAPAESTAFALRVTGLR